MAMNDDAVLVAATGYVYTAPVGALRPTPAQIKTLDLDNPAGWGIGLTVWETVGHTSEGELPEFGVEGGESEVRNSWQKKKLREVTPEEAVDSLLVNLSQFDDHTLGLYYGENTSTEEGVFGVAASKTGANEKAILVIIEDGGVRLGFYAPKASVKRDDAIALETDDLAMLPIRATFLSHNDEDLFQWLNEDLFNPAP